MSRPTTSRVYGDIEKTPVPFPAYRCRATATEPRPHAPHSTLYERLIMLRAGQWLHLHLRGEKGQAPLINSGAGVSS